LGRGNQKKRSGVVNKPLYADHLNIYHYHANLDDDPARSTEPFSAVLSEDDYADREGLAEVVDLPPEREGE